jgi:hypothetical protein
MRRCYDPRDPRQSEHDPATWRLTDNPILVAAGEVCASVPAERIDWAAIAEDADDFERQSRRAHRTSVAVPARRAG